MVANYYDTLAARAVLRPTTSADLRRLLDEPAPAAGMPFPDLLDTMRDVVEEFSRHNAHPRFFGYVSSPGTPVNGHRQHDRGGPQYQRDLLALRARRRRNGAAHHPLAQGDAGLSGGWRGPAGERRIDGELRRHCGGAQRESSGNVVREGMGGARMRLYASAEAHFSIRKAAAMLGIGAANVRVREDGSGPAHGPGGSRPPGARRSRCRPPALLRGGQRRNRRHGRRRPDRCDRRFRPRPRSLAARGWRLRWIRRAGAIRARLFARIGDADSVSLDPHKWLYLPVGCGCVLYRDPAAARAAFSENADYTRVVGLEHDEAFAFWDYGPELSRPFRALDLWLLLKSVGTRALGEAIEENIACAHYFADLVSATDDFEMLAPVDLSIFCFRYHPRGFDGDLDALNEHVMVALQRGGSSYLSNAACRGKFALRGCVLNYRTTNRDMEILLEDVRRAARSTE